MRVSSVDLEVVSRGYSGLKRATSVSVDSLVGRSIVKSNWCTLQHRGGGDGGVALI